MTTEMPSTAPVEAAVEEQSDYDKLRRIPFLYGFNIVNTAALLCTTSAPLALYAAELGVPKDGIGLLGGVLPFAQVLCIAFLPLVMRFGHRRIAAIGYGVRYLFLIPFLFAPIWRSDPNVVFWILFAGITMFAVLRTLAETAVWPWSQEYTPRFVRGRISGSTALLSLPAALGVSFLVELWLDSRTGIERFFPVFIVGILMGVAGATLLFGLSGGRPHRGPSRGLETVKGTAVPLRDRNFLAYLYSSGTQLFAFTVVNLFIVLYCRERLGIASGELVLMSAIIPVGGALGGVVCGWFTDRYGTRAIRIVLQVLEIALLLALLAVNPGVPGLHLVIGAIFLLFGLFFQSAITVGGIYMLNYVPPARKESYMAVAYTSDGLIGGGVTFIAGVLLQYLSDHPLTLIGVPVGNYEALFVLAALAIATSAVSFGLLREEGGTGVREFLRQFRSGHPWRALWSIFRYGNLTSEERRRDIAWGFGGTRSALVKEELITALTDPSFDVRHEAIQSLGHLPNSPAVVAALERVLGYHGLVELQYAALTSLGRIRAAGAADRIAPFLDDPNPLLRARAMRTLGDIRAEQFLPRIRVALASDPEVDVRLAAASALGKLRDRDSVDGLLALYRSLAADETSIVGEPRSKVVLLALSKILGCEESFSREWRREEKVLGYRLPSLVVRLSAALRRLSTEESEQHSTLLTNAASELALGNTGAAFRALQSLRPYIAASPHPDAGMILKVMDGTRDIARPHRALLILLSLVMRPPLVQ